MKHEIASITAGDTEWKYFLSDNEETYSINFTYPSKLQFSTKSKSIYDEMFEGEESTIKSKLASAINVKYRLKLTDSFHTKFKMFVFYQYLTSEGFDKYFSQDIKTINGHFSNFHFTGSLADIYSSQYYQKSENMHINYEEDGKEYQKKVIEITSKLFDHKKKYDKCYTFEMTKDSYRRSAKKKSNNITSLYEELKQSHLEQHKTFFTKNYFKKLLSKTTCEYCGISIEQIDLLGEKGLLHNKRSDTRGYSLEIDRKHPNKEYSNENCCMACYWCNNAKTDEFKVKEFREIARGINAIWNQRLKKIDEMEEVIFPPDDSPIWNMK